MTPPVASLGVRGGRRLAYAEFGAPEGEPLVYCHGFPGSRLEAVPLHQAASQFGLRVIAPDRPGCGESESYAHRRLLDWPTDLQAMADALAIERFHLMGVSGGGPYALATAAGLADRLKTVTLVCPLGPLTERPLLEAMHQPSRFVLKLARFAPSLARGLFRHGLASVYRNHPKRLLALQRRLVPPADAETLSHAETLTALGRSMSEAVHHGPEGLLQDLQIYVAPWGLDPGAITLPITLLHGLQDATVPAAHSRWLAATLPNAHAHFLDNEGHFSLPVRQARRILQPMGGTRPG